MAKNSAILLLLLLAQWIFQRYLKLFGVAPNIFLIWVLLLSLSGLRLPSLVWAILLGILDDLIWRNMPGKGALGLIIAGYLSGFPNRNPLISVSFEAIFVFVFSILYLFVRAFNWSTFAWSGRMFLKTCLIFGSYNVLISQILLRSKLLSKVTGEKAVDSPW